MSTPLVQSAPDNDFESSNTASHDPPARFRYMSPCDDNYSVFRQGKWVDVKQTKLAPTFISLGIDMNGDDIYDERPWDVILLDAKKHGRKTLPCVIHIAYCNGRPVKMNKSVNINSIVADKY